MQVFSSTDRVEKSVEKKCPTPEGLEKASPGTPVLLDCLSRANPAHVLYYSAHRSLLWSASDAP